MVSGDGELSQRTRISEFVHVEGHFATRKKDPKNTEAPSSNGKQLNKSGEMELVGIVELTREQTWW